LHSRPDYTGEVDAPRFGANTILNRSIDEPFTEQELIELAPIGEMMYQGFGKNVCEGNGVGPAQAAAVRADYTNLLQALDAHFANDDFLLGPRPCLADFARVGACKAHFVTDPVPVIWLGQYRGMLFAYTNRLFGNHSYADCHWPTDDKVPDSLQSVLDYAQNTYFQFARANITAGLAGEKFYAYDYGFGPTRARTQKRLIVAQLHVQDELLQLGASGHASINALFARRGILEHYLS
jgi:hypothetical protein